MLSFGLMHVCHLTGFQRTLSLPYVLQLWDALLPSSQLSQHQGATVGFSLDKKPSQKHGMEICVHTYLILFLVGAFFFLFLFLCCILKWCVRASSSQVSHFLFNRGLFDIHHQKESHVWINRKSPCPFWAPITHKRSPFGLHSEVSCGAGQPPTQGSPAYISEISLFFWIIWSSIV